MTAAETRNPLLESALSYARMGWPVFPAHSVDSKGECSCGERDCNSKGKHPRTTRGLTDATTDLATVAGWWTRWPSANIGVRTGRVGDRYLVALDVDPRHEGDDSLADLESRCGRLPPTLRALTGGGGEHILFWSREEIRSSVSVLGRGIDVRGEGGYIIGAESVHASGRRYAWDSGHHPSEATLAELPEWVSTSLAKRRPKRREDAPPPSYLHGGRNSALTSLAGSMRDRGMGAAAIEAALMLENEEKCAPPLDPKEVQRIVSSVCRYAPKNSPETGPVMRALRSLEERVRELVGLGPVVRLETGIKTLDASCRGGLPFRRLVVLGGAPGAGKTSLATWLGWKWAKTGVPVVVLAVDEGPEGTLMRIAQMEGISANRIEERDAEVLEALAQRVSSVPLTVVGEDDEGSTVEAAAALLAQKAEGQPAVLIVDSLQTVRCEGHDGKQSPKDRVDTVVRALKAVREKYGFMVVTTCELARGAYRSRNVAETINDLAAFKESGSIEYAAQTALVLRSVPEESQLIDVSVPKNRAYKRDFFRLRMDALTCGFAEIDAQKEDIGNVPALERFQKVRRNVFRACAKDTELGTPDKIALATGGRRSDVLKVVKALIEDGDLVLVGDGYRPRKLDASQRSRNVPGTHTEP